MRSSLPSASGQVQLMDNHAGTTEYPKIGRETQVHTKNNNGNDKRSTNGNKLKNGTSTMRSIGRTDKEQIAISATTGINTSAKGMINGLPVNGRCSHHGSDITTTIGASARSGVAAGNNNNKEATKGIARTEVTASMASFIGPWTGVPSSLRCIHQDVCGVLLCKSSSIVAGVDTVDITSVRDTRD